VIAHDQRLSPRSHGQRRRLAGRPRPGPEHHDPWPSCSRHDVGRLKPGTRYAQAFADQRPVDGERVPTLDALFEMVRASGQAKVRFNIETKISPLTPELAPEPEALARMLLGRRCGVTAWKSASRCRASTGARCARCKGWRRAAAGGADGPPAGDRQPERRPLDRRPATRGPWRLGAAAGEGARCGNVVAVSRRTHEALLAEAHALGLKVIPWTVNDPTQIDRLMAWAWTVSSATNRLGVREAMARRGMGPAPHTR